MYIWHCIPENNNLIMQWSIYSIKNSTDRQYPDPVNSVHTAPYFLMSNFNIGLCLEAKSIIIIVWRLSYNIVHDKSCRQLGLELLNDAVFIA
jgi:hypothetical protein